MAEPGLTEYVTLIQRRRQKELRDNITNNNYLLKAMKDTDSYLSYSGGRSIIEEMMFDENDSFTRYYGSQVISTALNYTMTSAEFDHKQFAVAIVLSGLEERMSSGPEAAIDLATARVKVAEATLANNLQADMISDGTADGGLQIGGLKLIISKTPTSGTVGGIDRSTTAGAFYQNFKFDTVNDTTAPAPGGVAMTAATAKTYFNYCIDSTMRGPNDYVNLLIAGQTHYQHLQNSLQAMQRVVGDADTIKSGGRKLIYEGIPVYNAGGVAFGAQTQVQTDLTYGINTRYLKMRYHKDANFEPLPEVQSINQDSKCKLMIFMGNMTCSGAKLQFVMFDS